ncbi:MAG: hypothetical protein BWY77_01113 [bacterium ADurb.Bin431]|nr:MAG: hypothetical protein BWY77_01113 [bacterium ADurb.Bin431]
MEAAQLHDHIIGRRARVVHRHIQLDIGHPGRPGGVAEGAIIDIEIDFEPGDDPVADRAVHMPGEGHLSGGLQLGKFVPVQHRNQGEDLLKVGLRAVEGHIHLRLSILHSIPAGEIQHHLVHAHRILAQMEKLLLQIDIEAEVGGKIGPIQILVALKNDIRRVNSRPGIEDKLFRRKVAAALMGEIVQLDAVAPGCIRIGDDAPVDTVPLEFEGQTAGIRLAGGSGLYNLPVGFALAIDNQADIRPCDLKAVDREPFVSEIAEQIHSGCDPLGLQQGIFGKRLERYDLERVNGERRPGKIFNQA